MQLRKSQGLNLGRILEDSPFGLGKMLCREQKKSHHRHWLSLQSRDIAVAPGNAVQF